MPDLLSELAKLTREFVDSGSIRTSPPDADALVFNPAAEQRPWAEQASLRDQRIARMVTWAATTSPMYREWYQGIGVSAQDVTNLETLSSLPVLRKDVIRNDQLQSPPFGTLPNPSVAVGISKIVKTSGTTGAATFSTWTDHDWNLVPEMLARNLWAAGLRPGMGCVHLWPTGGAQIASFWVRDAVEKCGAVPIILGGRDFLSETEQSLDAIVRLGSGMELGAVASFPICEKVGRALRERGEESPFRFFILAGQPSTPAMRDSLRELHPRATIFDHWASTEVQTISECSAGRYHLQEDLAVHEIVDPSTGTPVAWGEKGVILLTSLIQHTMPLIRFCMDDIVVNDVIREACDCGRLQATMSALVVGRSSDLFDAGGKRFLPWDLQQALEGVPGLTGTIQVLARADGSAPSVRVKIECAGEATEQRSSDVTGRLMDRLGVPVEVTLLPPDAIEMATSVKSQLIVWE